MKKAFFLIMMSLVVTLVSQAQITIDYPFGKADVQTVILTDDTLATFEPVNQWTFANVSIDTNVTVTCVPDNGIKTGALLFVEITSDTANRRVLFGDNLTATIDTVYAGKTKIYTFVYNGGYKLVSDQQIN